MREAVIISVARTPIGRAYRGAFNDTHGAILGGHVVGHAIARAGIAPREVEDVILPRQGQPDPLTEPKHTLLKQSDVLPFGLRAAFEVSSWGSTRMARNMGMCAAAMLGLGLLCASGAARAGYDYTFTLTPLNGAGANASGMFTLDSMPSTSFGSFALFTSGAATFRTGNIDYNLDQVSQGSRIRSFDGSTYNLSLSFVGSDSSLSIFGAPTVTANKIEGNVSTLYGTNYSTNPILGNGPSFFDAILSSGGNSGGGSSGAAPSPEVNAAVGLVIAGATITFLRRKRAVGPGPSSA